MPTILIIEDDTRVATLLQRGLEEQDFQTQIAYDGEMGKKLCQSNTYDLVITDIILPKISGLDLCQQLKKSYPSLPIIMLTALGTTDDKVDGFDAGADDYLVKPFDFRELLARIRVLLKRNSNAVLHADTFTYFDLELDYNTKTIKRSGKEINLTPKEFKLLEYMMQNAERVLSRTEIAEKVWNTHFDTGTNFIDVYINYLRKKIDKDFDTKLIHTKSGMGFILKNGDQ
ncbi:response regulator transcription factor [Flavobacterium sp. '19STA2R22 D10 B1']|uniref:response regulator transcription factor n=1 Tax=Flavobacterium aerium TaxID=3037261 RepID=UPI00278BD591|nr:response regulator transcription factor [Flavobacterium sp. '19STA2R22 D10 B1']